MLNQENSSNADARATAVSSSSALGQGVGNHTERETAVRTPMIPGSAAYHPSRSRTANLDRLSPLVSSWDPVSSGDVLAFLCPQRPPSQPCVLPLSRDVRALGLAEYAQAKLHGDIRTKRMKAILEDTLYTHPRDGIRLRLPSSVTKLGSFEEFRRRTAHGCVEMIRCLSNRAVSPIRRGRLLCLFGRFLYVRD
jgi:hypothetical protein